MIMGSEALETCGRAHDRDQYRDGARQERDSRVFTGWSFFLLANNLLTLFSIYWLEDAAFNQLVSQRATKCLIDFVRGITSFSGKGLTSTQAWRGSVRCPSLDADCKHFCLLCAKALNLHFCFEKNKKNNTHMQRLQKPDLISLVDLILDGHY